jgi:hypothetical protein
VACVLSVSGEKENRVITKEEVQIKGFYHRPNADGTEDSICPYCYTVIASSPNGADLDTAEAGHLCWQKFGETRDQYEQLGASSASEEGELS